ncbi:FecR family protein [Chitinophaga sp.]|uniref:FecR family protein n=1 Tax=Chitinophaga sp. TaxID=1869181 RepID=UPI002F9455AF
MAPKKYPRAHALLEKFYAGKCTPEELAILDSWYDGLDNIADISAVDTAHYQQQFLANFRNSLPEAKIVRWKQTAIKWTAAAASVILLAGAGYWWLHTAQQKTMHPGDIKSFLVTNETSNAKLVVLPDSSHIWLNAAASLRWKEDFNQKVRSVQLTGEGFFDVQGQTGKPFIIRTRDLTIQVLGTKFNVEAYPAEGVTRVSLQQGKVKVGAGKDSTILKPGYAAVYNNEDKGLAVAAADASKMAVWRDGVFIATDLPLRDAVTRLCTRYGYNVHWENAQGADKIISVMFIKETFVKTLDNLCYISRKHYRIAEKQVTIY